MREPNMVILAGGISSRMWAGRSVAGGEPGNNAADTPKSMISVGNSGRPFIDYLIRNAVRAGYRDITIVVGAGENTIRGYVKSLVDERLPSGFEMSVIDQPVPPGRAKPMGTADALLRALDSRSDWRGAWFTVCNSDNLYSVGALRVLLESGYDNAMIDYNRSALRFDERRISSFAVIKKDADGFLVDIVEKPGADEIRSAGEEGYAGVSMNVFRFSYDMIYPFLSAVPESIERQEKELPAAVKMMIKKHPRSVFAYPRAEHVPDLTSREDIAVVGKYLEEEYDPGEN